MNQNALLWIILVALALCLGLVWFTVNGYRTTETALQSNLAIVLRENNFANRAILQGNIQRLEDLSFFVDHSEGANVLADACDARCLAGLSVRETPLKGAADVDCGQGDLVRSIPADSPKSFVIGTPKWMETNNTLAPIAYRVIGGGGWVSACFETDTIRHLWKTLELPDGSSMAIVRRDEGTLWIREPFKPELLGRDLSDGPLFQAMRADPSVFEGSAEITATKTDNVVRIVQWSPLDVDDLVLVAGYPKDFFFAQWLEREWLHLLTLGVLGTALFGLIFWTFRSTGQRLRQVSTLAERLSIATRGGEIGIFDYDFTTGRLDWNDEMFRIYGVQKARFGAVFESWRELVHPEDLPAVEKTFERAQTSRERFRTEFRIQRPNGGQRWVIATAEFAYDEVLRPYRVFGVNIDVTDRRELERKLEHSQRLEVVGKLTGGIAHDFNNILHVISGNTELVEISLEDTLKDRPLVAKQLRKVLESVGRGAALTKRLLAFSRQDSLSPRTISVSETLIGIEDILQRTLGEEIDLSFNLAADLPKAFLDQHQLENAIINLALNSRDAMQAGGKLVVSAARLTLDEPQSMIAGENADIGEYVQITVQDSGDGIPSSSIEKVIEPFFTTKDVSRGSGLGLSMVYGFIKQSNGFMRIESSPQAGTMVTLLIPKSDDIVLPASVSDAVIVPAGSGTVLVVEDDPRVQEITVFILEEAGYTVHAAYDAAEATHIIEQTGSKIDILFTDIVLSGGVTGLELANAARQRIPNLKVLYASGYTDRFVTPDSGLVMGENLVRKPYKKTELLLMIAKLVGANEER